MRFDAKYIKSKASILLMYCLALQIMTAVAMYCSARAFDLGIGFFEASFAGTVSGFLASVPITVFGGLGVYELSTVGLLQIFGVPVEAGAAMILVVRALFFVIMAVAFVVVRPPRKVLHGRTAASEC
jgi:uncharacterized membrane protein YbhN (UPF0104 family)